MPNDSQLLAIEQRLSRIEERLGMERLPASSVTEETKARPKVQEVSPPVLPAQEIKAARTPPTANPVIEDIPVTVVSPPTKPAFQTPGLAPWHSPAPTRDSSTFATTLMAVGGGISFLLAAAYFVGLIYVSGWLTPGRQIGIASVAGIGLIWGGILFSQYERRYSSYLPAVGIAILYLASYAANVLYDLVSFPFMMITVALISLMALALDRFFKQTVFSVMATVAVYLTPLLAGAEANLVTTIVYYTAWSLLFSFMSLQLGKRLIYLIAMYMAIISFDASWRFAGQPEWEFAFFFQFAQFFIFAGTAATFSYVHRQSISDGESAAHGLPLFFFYITQVILLKQHAPQMVEVFGLVSVGVVLGLYFFGRNRLDEKSKSGATALISLYSSVVVAHVIFFEFLPIQLLPWAVLAIPAILLAVRSQFELTSVVMIPILFVTSILVASGLALAFAPTDFMQEPVMGAEFVLPVYALMLYVSYWLLVQDPKITNLSPGILYAGHVALLVGIVRLFDDQLIISVIWAVLAVTLLVIAIQFGDRVLGQSSLLIFIASGLKVVMFDLAGSPGMIRIGILIVLGISLYAGGWLYQNLVRKTQVFHTNRAINDQLRRINVLVQQGYSNEQIVEKLVKDKVACQAVGGWSPALITKIRSDYQMI